MRFEQWRAWLATHRFRSLLLLPERGQDSSLEEELEQAYQDLAVLQQTLAQAQQETEKYYGLYTEAQGDLRRVKQRLEQTQEESTRKGQQALLRDLLPVFDDLWRAFQEKPDDLADHPWVIGMALVAKELTATLEKLDIMYAFGDIGQRFDPRWYEAVAVVVRTDLEEGTIVEVHQQGYVLGKRVLRPARVTVSALKKPVSVSS